MKKLSFLIIFFIVLLIILLHFVGVLLPVENFFRRLINPGSILIYQWSIALNEEEVFDSVEDLENAYIELKDKYNQRVVDFSQWQGLQAENKELRGLLNFSERTDFNVVPARVIGKSVDNLRNAIIIDKGAKNGVHIENSVVGPDGFYIGKISKVESEISLVRLLNDQSSKLAATVLGRDKSIGIVEGGYGLSIQMNLIPQNEAVEVGDIIMTSGLERDVPRGLLIGEVNAVEKEAYQPFQKAIITPYLEFEKIQVVSVITDLDI